jgi:two-component system NtrC family sensor kinase
MDAQSQQPVVEGDPEQVPQGLQPLALLGPVALMLALTAWYWGQWTVVLGNLGAWAGIMLVNRVVFWWLAPRLGRSWVETVWMLVKVAGIAVCGVLTHWSPLVWVFVPYNVLWFFSMDRWVRLRIALYLVGVDAVALLTGASVEMALACTVFSVFGYLVSDKRASQLRGALEQVLRQREQLAKAHQEMEQANQELRQMHQRALDQERLSSLGMLAAGVAHEINNPMSFVTSNVNSMLRDLRDEPNLSQVMKEYVEDVLPATLDGIKRVNSIVADLRRFARGDPEAHTGYELDAEVEAALRIAHGQLGHLRVEKDLGGVGMMVGRPRQIAQVLVNLLVNAGQATAPGGLVRVTTRRDSDAVRVEVRDTGTGMSEETRRHLFEPFFTTKPPGEGTGLGLSVVHGIVKSHGGRIAVESAPGQGTCFIIRLPLVPPLLQYEPSTDGGMRRRKV